MMLAPVRHCSAAMSFPLPSTSPTSRPSPPKRPRLSLQIKTPSVAQTFGKSSTALKADIDPTSPTAFNTLSNAYAVAIENASPITPKASSTTDSRTGANAKSTPLRLETSIYSGAEYVHPSQRTQTPGPFSTACPDTPITAFPSSTPTIIHPDTQKVGGAPFTFTPPQSAGSREQATPRVFTFAAQTSNKASPSSPRTPRRRATINGLYQSAPYTHPRSLRSILRNSPLPPRSTVTPVTPRTTMRLANRGSKRVGYNDPLTQTITTNKYTSSHIDLLAEDEAQNLTADADDCETTLDLTMAYTGDETRDGGQTPGPFEEMRRRMAGLGGADSDPETPATRKRKRREKKRKWVWTIGAAEDADESDQIVGTPRTPATTLRDESTPATAILWRGSSVSSDSEMESLDERPTTSQSL